MAPEKVTKMVLDVDLKCSDCYNKVKKVICKIPEIRDQEYDFDKNKVKITVVCCCPERVRDKLSHKGGKSVQKIEIIVADKPKEKSSADDKPKPKPKPKESDKPKGDNNDKPKAAAPPPPKAGDTAAPKKAEVAKMMFEPPVDGYPQMYPPTMTTYPMVGYGYQHQHQQQQQQGYGGSPYQHSGYGMPGPSTSGYGYGYAYNNPHGYNGTNNYSSEETQQECSIM